MINYSITLYLAVDCMREQLLEGKKIRLGDLGDFSVSLTSKGAESADKFSASNITAVNVVWDCGQDFKNLLADAEFQLVASRSAQAAVLKAVKAGESNVDLNAQATTSGSAGTQGGNTQGSGSNPSGGNTQGSGSGNQGGNTPSTPTPTPGGTGDDGSASI